MNRTAYQQWEMTRILDLAFNDIVKAAAQAGIDGKALLAQLPPHSVRLTGNQVPVLEKRYRGTCSVTYYFNQNPAGEPWPFFRFHTFKDGGVTADFNGCRWLKENRTLLELTRHEQQIASNEVIAKSNVQPEPRSSSAPLEAEDKSRAEYFSLLQKGFKYATPVAADHPYIRERLAGYANQQLLSRVMLRNFRGKLMAPLERINGEHTGFQLIMPDRETDNKRNHVAYPGAMRGSFVRISAVSGLRYFPIMFCEGIFTALSLALVWPGEIRAVLSCHNYAGCRDHLNEHVYFAHDNDVYKPQIGNVGLKHAKAASRQGDIFIAPQFLPMHQHKKPTDFNDMLQLYGVSSLQQTIEQAMVEQSALSG